MRITVVTGNNKIKHLLIVKSRTLVKTHQIRNKKPVAYLISGNIYISTGPTDLGFTDIVEHEINLSDNTPFKDPYLGIPPAYFEEVRQLIKEYDIFSFKYISDTEIYTVSSLICLQNSFQMAKVPVIKRL